MTLIRRITTVLEKQLLNNCTAVNTIAVNQRLQQIKIYDLPLHHGY